MDDVALCHIIIIIIITITLFRWSRNTLSTQSIPSCTTHSVKLNTGTRPNTGRSLMPTPCEGETYSYFSGITLHPVKAIKRYKIQVMSLESDVPEYQRCQLQWR